MSTCIGDYFKGKAFSQLEQNAFSKSYEISADRLQSVWEEYMNIDTHCMYYVTFTSKFKRDKTFQRRLYEHLISNEVNSNFIYVLFPAYQPKSKRLHYHGIMWYRNKEHHKIGDLEFDDIGISKMNSLMKYCEEFTGFMNYNNIQRDCKEKGFDPQREYIKIRNYIYSEKNFLGCDDYPVITNHVLGLFG